MTVLWSANGGSFSSTTSASTTYTAPSTTGDYTITLVATDEYDATVTVTADISVTASTSPTLSVTAPSTADRDETVDVSVTITNPDNDTVTVLWTAPSGTFADNDAESTTYTLPDEPGTFTVTCTLTDSADDTSSDTADIVVSNAAPTISLTVPSDLETTETASISASVADADGDTVTVRWTADGGSFANNTALSTTWNPPSTAGDYTLTLTATDEYDGESTATASIDVNKAPSVTITTPFFADRVR